MEGFRLLGAGLLAEAGDEGPGALDEGRLVVALELGPGGEGLRVDHAVDEEQAVEVVDLVLEGSGGEASHDAVDGMALAVEGGDPDLRRPRGHTRKPGTERQPS